MNINNHLLISSSNRSTNNSSSQNCKNKKFDFNDYKKKTINSLNEVEYFLNNLDKVFKCLRVYKFFR